MSDTKIIVTVYVAMAQYYEEGWLLGVYSTMPLAQAAVYERARDGNAKLFPVYVGPADDYYGDAQRRDVTLIRFEDGDNYQIARHRIEVDEEHDKGPA